MGGEMYRIVSNFLIIVFASLFSQEAISATINLSVQSLEERGGTSPRSSNDSVSLDTVIFPFESITARLDVAGFDNPLKIISRSYANGDQGEFQLNTSSDVFPSVAGSTAVATASISETYLATGQGFMTARFAVDGVAFIDPLFSDLIVQGSVCIACNTGSFASDFFYFDTVPAFGSRRYDVELVVRKFIDADLSPILVNVFWDILIQQFGPGALDFQNTGKAFIETDGTLEVMPSDPEFLSDPAYTSTEVPIPASFLLLISGIIAITRIGAIKKTVSV